MTTCEIGECDYKISGQHKANSRPIVAIIAFICTSVHLEAIKAFGNMSNLDKRLNVTIANVSKDTCVIHGDSNSLYVDVANISQKPITLAFNSCSYYQHFGLESDSIIRVANWFCDANFAISKTIRPKGVLRYRIRLRSKIDSAVINTALAYYAVEISNIDNKITSSMTLNSTPFVIKFSGIDTTENIPYCWPIVIDKNASNQLTQKAKWRIAKQNGLANFKMCPDEY